MADQSPYPTNIMDMIAAVGNDPTLDTFLTGLAPGMAPGLGAGVPGQLPVALAQLAQAQDTSHQRAQESAAGAEQAATTYNRAAAQPVPGRTYADALQSLFGNIGSAVSRNPEIAAQVGRGQTLSRQEMMEARAQRLQGLHDEYMQKAELARQMGQTDTSMNLEINANKALAAMQQLQALHLKDSELKAGLFEAGIGAGAHLGAAKIGAGAEVTSAQLAEQAHLVASLGGTITALAQQGQVSTPLVKTFFNAQRAAGVKVDPGAEEDFIQTLHEMPLSPENLLKSGLAIQEQFSKMQTDKAPVSSIKQAAIMIPTRALGLRDTPEDMARWQDAVENVLGPSLLQMFTRAWGQTHILEPKKNAFDKVLMDHALRANFPRSYKAVYGANKK